MLQHNDSNISANKKTNIPKHAVNVHFVSPVLFRRWRYLSYSRFRKILFRRLCGQFAGFRGLAYAFESAFRASHNDLHTNNFRYTSPEVFVSFAAFGCAPFDVSGNLSFTVESLFFVFYLRVLRIVDSLTIWIKKMVKFYQRS